MALHLEQVLCSNIWIPNTLFEREKNKNYACERNAFVGVLVSCASGVAVVLAHTCLPVTRRAQGSKLVAAEAIGGCLFGLVLVQLGHDRVKALGRVIHLPQLKARLALVQNGQGRANGDRWDGVL